MYAYIDDVKTIPILQVMAILGETLESFDEDGIIPAFGFGDIRSKDRRVFAFKDEVQFLRHVRLS